MSTTSRTVSFRIGPDHYDRLAEAAAAENRSPGDYARLRLLDCLDGDGGRAELMARLGRLEQLLTDRDGQPTLLDRIARLEGWLTDVRHDLPLTARALLIAAGQREACSPAAAERWAQENLRTQD